MNTKRLLSTVMLLLVTASLLLAACAPAAPATPAAADPTAIAQEFYKATNAGDIEAAMALVAEDVKCRGGCYLTGKEAFRSFIQGSINLGRGGHVELSDLQVEGDKVTYYWKAYNKDGNLSASGVEALQIRDGLIILMETNL